MNSRAVFCEACRRPVDPDDEQLPMELRSPCPHCGGKIRLVEVHAFDSAVVTMKGYLEMRTREARPDGRGGWIRETVEGDNFHRDGGEWRYRRRVIDKGAHWYAERIVAPDGAVVRDVGEPLREHRGHGPAKRGKPSK